MHDFSDAMLQCDGTYVEHRSGRYRVLLPNHCVIVAWESAMRTNRKKPVGPGVWEFRGCILSMTMDPSESHYLSRA